MKVLRVIKFTIPTAPQSVQHGSRFGRGHFFSDSKKVKYIDSIIAESKHHAPDEPWHGPISIRMDYYLGRPSWLRGSDAEMAWQLRGVDLDNLCKGTNDALGRAGYWLDDGQIFSSTLRKLWHEEGLFPRIEVEITFFELPEGNCPPAIKKLLKERVSEGP